MAHWVQKWLRLLRTERMPITLTLYRYMVIFAYSRWYRGWHLQHGDYVSYLNVFDENSNLEQFVNQYLVQDPNFVASCNPFVDRLIGFIQKHTPDSMKPARVFRGGSIGKGTDLRDETKIELIFYVSGRHRLQAVAEQMEELLTVLEQYLQHYRECRFVRKTKQAVHVDLFCHGDHEHRVEILPVYDVLQAQSKREIYEDMTKSDTLRQFYSTCLVKLQQAFVKEQPERVKNLIRLVKYWRKSKLPADEGKNKWPDSYLLELITIRRWEEAGKPATFDLRRGLYSVLHALVEYRDMKIQWLVNYDKIFMKQIRERNPAIHVPEIFKTPRSEGRIGTTARKQKYPGYYVIDPANPFSNVASTCELWHKVAEVAGESLQMPLFGGLGRSGLHNW